MIDLYGLLDQYIILKNISLFALLALIILTTAATITSTSRVESLKIPSIIMIYGAALSLALGVILMFVAEGKETEINNTVNEYIMESGGLDEKPEINAADIVYSLSENSKNTSIEEEFNFKIDTEPYTTTLVFKLDDKANLSIYAKDNTNTLTLWGPETALTTTKVKTINNTEKPETEKSYYIPDKMEQEVAAYILKTGKLDSAPQLKISSKIEQLRTDRIDSFQQVTNLTIKGKTYPTTLTFTKDENGALDIQVFNHETQTNTPLHPDSIIQPQTNTHGKIMLTEE